MGDDDDGKKNNMIILGVCSILLVAMVVALTIGIGRYDYTVRKEVDSSQKAIQSICQPTSYPDTCIKSLESSEAANATDPRELIQTSLHITINNIQDAMKDSKLLKEVEKDPRSKDAMHDCQLLAERAVNDLNRTFDQFSEFDLADLDNWLADLKTWLSGSLTYQQTCLDGFEGIPGDYQEKMKKLLTTSMQLTSNALAMVTEISSALSELGVEGVSSASKRRLLGRDELAPDWVDEGRHRLLTAKASEITADLVVAKDGSGKYKTINEAFKDIPRNKNKTFVLHIKEGVYEEQVTFYRNMSHLMVMGDGPTKTKITGSLNYVDGVGTYHTATVAALGDFFMARDIGFENSAGAEKHQAVALRVGADRSIFYNCQMDGYQDTLYTHTYRQFYRDCVISGTIDFIFGNGAVVLQNCTFVVRKPLDNQQNIVTAQGRIDPRQPTGLVLQDCSFVADPEYHPVRFTLKSYLGRPWKDYSRTIIMESFIDDLIQKEGWLPWNGDFALDTLFYTEYNNRGPASGKENRVKWKGVKELPLNRIERFTADRFIQGDSWVKPTGVPYNSGFIYPPPKPNSDVKYSPVVPDEIKDMGAKEKAEYDPNAVLSPPPPPPAEAPPQFSFASLFGGGSPPTEEATPASPPPAQPSPDQSSSHSDSTPVQGDGSNKAPAPVSDPASPAPVQASDPASASASSPASTGPVQASPQPSTAPVSTPAEAPADASASTSGPASPGPVQGSPQSSTAPVSAPTQASASTPGPVHAPDQSSTAPVSAKAPTPGSAPVQGSAPTPASTSASTPASPASTPPTSTPVSAAAPTNNSTSASAPSPLAETPAHVPVTAPPGNSATPAPAATPPGNSTTPAPAATPPGNSATPAPASTPPGNSATPAPAAATPGNSATPAPAATPPGNSATPAPVATPPGNTATPVPAATPPGNSATPASAATPPGNSATPAPVAAPSENLATEVKVEAASESLIKTPSDEAGAKTPSPPANQESKSSGWTFGIF